MSKEDAKLSAFQAALGVRFRNPQLLLGALAHPSYENGAYAAEHGRLWQLGHTLLAFLMTRELFNRFPKHDGDKIRQERNFHLNPVYIATLGEAWNIHESMLVGPTLQEQMLYRRSRMGIVAHAVTAFFGALLSDRGMDACEAAFRPMVENDLFGAKLPKEPTMVLQREVEKRFQKSPEYRELGQSGPAHKPVFKVGVYLGGSLLGEGEGQNKKEARRNAATAALASKATWLV